MLNDQFQLWKITKKQDEFGGMVQELENQGVHWCEVIKSDGFFREVKGGKKRVQTITLKTWFNKQIDHTCIIDFMEIRYSVVNALHSRKTGITTFNCEYNS